MLIFDTHTHARFRFAVQRSWLYLQPIFDSDDIKKQLPTESKRCVPGPELVIRLCLR